MSIGRSKTSKKSLNLTKLSQYTRYRYEEYITDSSEIPRHYDKNFVCEKIKFSFKAPISF